LRRGILVVAVLALGLAVAGSALAAPKPVPSLQPAATAKLWKQLVRAQKTRHPGLTRDCRPLRAVFYTSTDWLRLATKLAANASPCAQYFISIPPLAADKTAFRYDQPWRIRALGPSFHALAEINYTGWSAWVTANGGSWYAAGQEARRRMAANGFDVAAGDSWAVNEASSAVRAGTGSARQNLRDLVRGLYEGDGTVPQVKGAVFITGIGQQTSPLGTYKANLQSWYADTPFWTDMSAYVGDWSQEVYGDVRSYAVAGAPPTTRRDELNAYLQHPLSLANAGPAEITTAQSFLRSAYSPLANSAWAYDAAFGWTAVAFDQMQDYVSAQADALGSAGGHLGFAWALKNLTGLSSTDFATQTGAIADRLAAALHDTATACDGTCGLALDGAAFNEGWKDFAAWSQPALAFATGPLTLTAGAAAPLTVQLQVAGVARPESQPVTLALSSSSADGGFSTGPDGPWTSTLSLTVPAGSTDTSVYYRDTKAGTATVTAAGHGTATQTETVVAADAATVQVSPASASVASGSTVTFTAAARDAYGNAVTTAPSWTAAGGTVSPGVGASTTFTAGATDSATVTATIGTASASAAVTVTVPKVRVTSIAYEVSYGRLRITFTVRSGSGGPVAGANLAFAVTRNGGLYASGSAVTESTGTATVTISSALPSGCYVTAMKSVFASGFAWDGVTPANGYCR
jgi:hypothetical protein